MTLTFTSVGAKLGGTAAVVHVRKSNTELKQYNISNIELNFSLQSNFY